MDPKRNFYALSIRPALPSDYLIRQGLHNEVFGDSIRLRAIGLRGDGKPTLQITQPFVPSDKQQPLPTEPEIEEFMGNAGFVEIPKEMTANKSGDKDVRFWYRISDGATVYDTRPDNFVHTPSKDVEPVDLNIAIIPRQVMADIAKKNGVSWPELEMDAP